MLRVLSCVVAVLTGFSAPAEPVLCPQVPLEVTASDPALVARACAAATRATAAFADCGLPLLPKVHLDVLEPGFLPAPNCLAEIDCVTMVAKIAHPETLADKGAAVLRGVSDPELVFDSLVFHELAHAVVATTRGEVPVSRPGQEYISYVFQYLSMPDPDRARILAIAGTEAPDTLDQFNSFVLAMAPEKFAAKAWLHFSAPENGCEFVRRILDRDVVLGVGLR